MTLPSWFKGTLLLAVTFAGGVTSGVIYERRHTPGHDATRVDAHDAVHRLARDLNLDSEQQQSIAEILARHQKDIDSAWKSMAPHVRGALDGTHQEVLRVLRPEQAAKYRNMMERMHSSQHR